MVLVLTSDYREKLANMTNHLPLSFVQQKIIELRNALFFPVTESLLKLSVCIVNVIKVDELGQIWFAIPLPVQDIRESDKSFASKLDFFRHGKKFYLKIAGMAYIVTDPEEINTIQIDTAIKERARSQELVLMKVKITHADYFENKPEAVVHHSFFKDIFAFFQKLIFKLRRGFNWSLYKKIPVRGSISTH